MGCGVWIVWCGMGCVGCGVWGVGCGVWCVVCEVWGLRLKVEVRDFWLRAEG